ncbi:hypothetical protein [Leptospira interrogans]|uniref:hypothetical protein n=1 Tax=Leptospira interrogans TaxID=173 RepID=UPI0002BA9D5C|nr:hypothetical protein [Leptospira interrogans]EMN93347.1 hypothetical protein LEP1GSC110_3594 [Leptospira interrogans serovar Medanensis str. UT053]
MDEKVIFETKGKVPLISIIMLIVSVILMFIFPLGTIAGIFLFLITVMTSPGRKIYKITNKKIIAPFFEISFEDIESYKRNGNSISFKTKYKDYSTDDLQDIDTFFKALTDQKPILDNSNIEENFLGI